MGKSLLGAQNGLAHYPTTKVNVLLFRSASHLIDHNS